MKSDNKCKKSSKSNKTCIIQVRCTERERKQLDKYASKCNKTRSDYIRARLFSDKEVSSNNVLFAVEAQEFMNYVDDNYASLEPKIRKKVKELWNLL